MHNLCIAAMLLLFLSSAVQADEASFDCTKAATPIEKLICSSEDLKAKDRLMGEFYARAKTSAFGFGPSNIGKSQTEWRKARDTCIADGKTDKNCVASQYDSRNLELAIMLQPDDFHASYKVVEEFAPDAAPFLSALVKYADPTPDLASVKTSLQQYFENPEDKSFGASMLEGEGIRTADDAAANIKNFTTFMNIASAYVDMGKLGGRPIISCRLIIAKPELIDVVNPVFGSSMDNATFTSDCDASLPPLPKLDGLITNINATWPTCEGTIQYSAYRGFEKTILQARVATLEDIQAGNLSSKEKAELNAPSPAGITAKQAAAAVDELQAYYVTYRKAPKQFALTQAKKSIAAILADAHGCGD